MEEKVIKLLKLIYPHMSDDDISVIIYEFNNSMSKEEQDEFIFNLIKRYKAYVDNTKNFIQKTTIQINKLDEIEDKNEADMILNKL